jgi:hypothetical protein
MIMTMGIPMITGIPMGMTTGIPTDMSMTTGTTGTGITTTMAATCISAPAPPASMWPG